MDTWAVFKPSGESIATQGQEKNAVFSPTRTNGGGGGRNNCRAAPHRTVARALSSSSCQAGRPPLQPRPNVDRADRFYWPRIRTKQKKRAHTSRRTTQQAARGRRGIYDTRSCAAEEQLRSCLASAARWLRSSVDRGGSAERALARTLLLLVAGGPPVFSEDASGHS